MDSLTVNHRASILQRPKLPPSRSNLENGEREYQMEQVGSVPATDGLRSRIAEVAEGGRRELAWQSSIECADAAREAGCAGVILMGLRFDTVVDEAAGVWRSVTLAQQ